MNIYSDSGRGWPSTPASLCHFEIRISGRSSTRKPSWQFWARGPRLSRLTRAGWKQDSDWGGRIVYHPMQPWASTDHSCRPPGVTLACVLHPDDEPAQAMGERWVTTSWTYSGLYRPLCWPMREEQEEVPDSAQIADDELTRAHIPTLHSS
jgi:hypothetical protein